MIISNALYNCRLVFFASFYFDYLLTFCHQFLCSNTNIFQIKRKKIVTELKKKKRLFRKRYVQSDINELTNGTNCYFGYITCDVSKASKYNKFISTADRKLIRLFIRQLP